MSDKSLNNQISVYKETFASGEIQKTYQSLVGLVQGLRTDFTKKYKGEFSVANVMHGYIDFTYFYLQNDYLKRHKLKLAIVFNHQHARFELWLLGQTKDVQIHYWKKLKGVPWLHPEIMPAYSIFEIPLLAHPDFDNIAGLYESIHRAFSALSDELFHTLKAHE